LYVVEFGFRRYGPFLLFSVRICSSSYRKSRFACRRLTSVGMMSSVFEL